MYRGRLWTMRQYAGQEDAEATNRRFRFLLGEGQTGLSVAFDLPTQIGFDSDAPEAEGEVGKVGVAIDTMDDMSALLDGIPLDEVTTSMTINATASTVLAMYIAVAESQGVAPAQIGGTIQNDILKEYIARGTFIYPPTPSLRLITDTLAYCTREVPRWNSISVSGYHIREAGATAAQEIGFTLANAIAYVESARDAGLDFNVYGPQVSFFLAAHPNFLEEIAKFRAARRLWARIATERLGATNPKAAMFRFHTQTGGVTLTAQQPDNNIVRTALQALSAVMGGTQSLHTNSLDEALGLPTERAVEIALRTQQIIAYETGAGDIIDPLGGSFFIEQLTDELEAEAAHYIEQIDALGGAVRAIEQGYQQRAITEAAYALQLDVERETDASHFGTAAPGSTGAVKVGVNRFQGAKPVLPEPLHIDPEVGRRQIEKLERVRADRDASATRAAIDRIEQAAAGDENLLPPILTAVRAHATLGEIAGSLRHVWGEHHETSVV
jgi:methylmalonyl-CoA mutase N-terminal domain/subunit